MNRFLQPGKIPTWRLLFWSFVAMAGVGYFDHPEHPQPWFWIAVLSIGLFIIGFGLLLNWAPSSPWMRANAHWFIGIGMLVNILLCLWKLVDFALHKK